MRAYNETQDELTATGEQKDGVNRPRFVTWEGFHEFYLGEPIVGIDPLPGNEIFKARNGDIVSEWSMMSLAGVRIRMWKDFRYKFYVEGLR
ncbi:MAG: hypothetical protein ACLU4N_13670 [Butyricimonas faecihominis]